MKFLNFIPGFRSKTPIKMIIASIYYVFSLGMITEGFNYVLFALALPFATLGSNNLLKHKSKSMSLKNAFISFLIPLIVIIVAIGITPTDSIETTETIPQQEEKQLNDNIEKTNVESTNQTSAEQTTMKEETPQEPVNDPTISKSEFDSIKNGMTYEEVVKIIGSEGEVLSEVGEAGTDLYTIMYMWEGEGDLGANANFTFQSGKLQAKAQFGLD